MGYSRKISERLWNKKRSCSHSKQRSDFLDFAMIMTLIRLYAVWEKITCLRGARYDDFENVNMHCL